MIKPKVIQPQKEYVMDTALTGSTGHVGANLVRSILKQKRGVRVLVRQDLRAIEGLDVETTQGDISDLDFLMKLFKGVKTVFHLAAKISIVGPEGGSVEKVNVEGTKNVIEACVRSKVKRLVHFSSIHAYKSDPVSVLIDEKRPLALEDDEFIYDRTKALGQRLVMEAVDRGLDAVIINPTSVLGPYDYKPSRMGEVLLDLYNNRYPALVDGGYNWVDARDVVSCALAAEKKGRKGEAYLASGTWLHVCEVARMIAKMYNRKTPSTATPIWLCMLPAHVMTAYAKMTKSIPLFTPYAMKSLRSHRHISHEKATRELGYTPRPLEETIRDTLAWFAEQGTLEQAR
jgi:dihydroflavonol-4-reductase